MERGIRHCAEKDFRELADIWERSVRASHSFLGEADIAEIRVALVQHYFPAVELYGLEENDSLVGFVGLSGSNIEMLFIDGSERGRGIGSRLLAYALSLGAKSVDVNEQNPSALKFYQSKGFEIVGRDECDPAGRPFPILHLRLRSQSDQTDRGMRIEDYGSKVDWWVPAVVVFTAAVCLVGPLIDGELLWLGGVLAAIFCGFEIAMFGSVKYRIRGNELGIRNWLYGWEWFPIDKIQEAIPTTGILSAPALSVHRVSIRFSDRRILKSSAPLEISPADRMGFIARLREINPVIAV